MIVTALQAESLDALVWRATGLTGAIGAGAVDATLVANPGVARDAAALAEGTPIVIPALPATSAEVAIVQLWN